MAALVETYVGADPAWHGRGFVKQGLTLEQGVELAGIKELEWTMQPVTTVTEDGSRITIPGKFALVRNPTTWSSEYYVLPNRVVSGRYGLVQANFLYELAKRMQEHTGWRFQGAGILDKGKQAFVQLKIDKDMYIAGKPVEKHSAYWLFADDKTGGAGGGGLTIERVVCRNTFRIAVNEDAYVSVPHVGDVEAMMKFITFQAIAAIETLEEYEAFLNRLFVRTAGKNAFNEFVEATFPHPPVPRILTQEETLFALVDSDITDEQEMSGLFEKVARARLNYDSTVARQDKRREFLAVAIDRHARDFPENAGKYYSFLQGVTWLTNNAPFGKRDDAWIGSNVEAVHFGGPQKDANDNALAWLRQAVG